MEFVIAILLSSEPVVGGGLIFILGLLFWVAYTFYYFRNFNSSQAEKIKATIQAPFNPNVRKLNDFFQSNFPYFSELSSAEKKLFVMRVISFLRNKKIKGAGQFEVTTEIQMMIAASAVQVTFGLKQFLLSRFHTINVYKDVYIGNTNLQFYKGDVKPQGIINLSWNNFLAGYQDSTDKINLGLHEMAHALAVNQVFFGQEEDEHLREYMGKYNQLAAMEISNRQDGEPHFFRDYAFTNVHEFFAVSVEHFFEAPAEFKSKLPELYKYLCLVLNQDAANKNHRGFVITEYFNKANHDNKVTKEFSYSKPDFVISTSPNAMFPAFLSLLIIIPFFNIIMYIILTANDIPDSAYAVWFIILNAVILYVHIFRRIRKTGVMKNYLFVKKPFHFFSSLKIIHLENIICMKLSECIKITYFDNGYFRNHYITNNFTNDDLKDMKICLQEKRIFVRSEVEQLRSGFYFNEYFLKPWKKT